MIPGRLKLNIQVGTTNDLIERIPRLNQLRPSVIMDVDLASLKPELTIDEQEAFDKKMVYRPLHSDSSALTLFLTRGNSGFKMSCIYGITQNSVC